MRMSCLLVVVPYETQPYSPTLVMVNAAISDLSATGVCLSASPPLFSLNAFPRRKSPVGLNWYSRTLHSWGTSKE